VDSEAADQETLNKRVSQPIKKKAIRNGDLRSRFCADNKLEINAVQGGDFSALSSRRAEQSIARSSRVVGLADRFGKLQAMVA